MTASPAEIARLFAELASRIPQSGVVEGFGDAAAAAISSLSASLSSDDGAPGIRVLDAALSLMCFRQSEVHKARIDCLIGTIVAMLSSLSTCQVLQHPDGKGGRFVMVGNSFSSLDCVGLMRVCPDVMDSLKAHCAEDAHSLLYAVTKVVVASSPCQSLLPYSSTCSLQSKDMDCDMHTVLARLLRSLSDETSLMGLRHYSPLRLLFWYLDPSILKNDISEIVQEAIRRPFLCLRKELHDRISWCNILTCLVLSPTIFMQVRAILHRWFLSTGLASLLDLKIEIVSSVLDMLSRPMWWQMPLELGLKLPPSYAYFSARNHELLTMLMGQLSCNNLLQLVHYIKAEADDGLSNVLDSNFAWAVLMDFPAWFYFANALMFCRHNSEDHLAKALSTRLRTENVNAMELQKAAIYYISWIFALVFESCNILSKDLDELSQSLITKHKSNSTYEERSDSDFRFKNVRRNRSKKLKIPKDNTFSQLEMTAQDVSNFDIGEWLKKFNGINVRLCNTRSPKDDPSMKPNLLFTRVPIGILLMFPSHLDEMGCSMLLHYAATGQLMQSKETSRSTKDCYPHADLEVFFESDTRKWALSGACLMFNLLDIMEDMSTMLFDSDDDRIGFVQTMKHKTVHYLFRCLSALVDLHVNKTDEVATGDMMLDLHRRLLNWKQQGGEIFKGHKEFDDFVDKFSRYFNFSSESELPLYAGEAYGPMELPM